MRPFARSDFSRRGCVLRGEVGVAFFTIRNRRGIRNQRGSVFLGSMVLVSVMMLLGFALFDLASIEARVSTRDTAWNQLLYCANAGLGRVMVDTALTPAPGGRMTQITSALATPGSTITWPTAGTEPLNLGGFTGFTCGVTTTFTDDTVNKVRLLRTTATAPSLSGQPLQRTVQIQLDFLPQSFQYAGVADSSNVYLGGIGPPPPTVSGPGGSDVINGNLFVGCKPSPTSPCGQVYVGSPSITCTGTTPGTCTSSVACAAGQDCRITAATGPQGALVNPRILPAGITGPATPTVATTLPLGSGAGQWDKPRTERSMAYPSTGDPNSFQAAATNLPAPDVVAYMNDIRAAVGMLNGSPGSPTGTFQGSPVFNFGAIFAALGSNADGSLKAPTPCTCGTTLGTNCRIYCQLQPLGVLLNPQQGNYATLTNSTPGTDFFITGVGNTELCNTAPYCGHTVPGTNTPSAATGQAGAQADVNIASTFPVPPIFIANGNLWWNNAGAPFGLRVEGRALFVATNDVYVSDNILYHNGIGPRNAQGVPTGCPTGSADPACNPNTADMLGFISGRDIWYGDPIPAYFNEAAAIMLAGRDINYVFQTGNGTLLVPNNPIILNGTMLANGNINLFRDYANSGMTSAAWTPSTGSNSACGNGSSGPTCLPVAFNPKDTTCGSTIGCWNFLTRNTLSGAVTYCTQAPPATCGPNCAATCTFTAGGAPISRSLSSFKDCGPTASDATCKTNNARRITHYQMTFNYDPRLYNPALVPPGMTLNVNLVTGQVSSSARFASSWKGWRECTSTTCN